MESLLRLPAVQKRTGLGKTEIYNEMKEGDFPRNYKYDDDMRIKFWVESEINAWIEAKIAQGKSTDHSKAAYNKKQGTLT